MAAAEAATTWDGTPPLRSQQQLSVGLNGDGVGLSFAPEGSAVDKGLLPPPDPELCQPPPSFSCSGQVLRRFQTFSLRQSSTSRAANGSSGEGDADTESLGVWRTHSSPALRSSSSFGRVAGGTAPVALPGACSATPAQPCGVPHSNSLPDLVTATLGAAVTSGAAAPLPACARALFGAVAGGPPPALGTLR